MSERRGTKALELWCRRITEGYPGVNVQNMTTSWRDGLAFCAMIHHFRSDLVDFNALNKDDVYGNNELAFRTAEQHLGIPALLDAEDMASCAVPDRLSILTYLSQFYQTFGGLSPSRPAMKRAKEEETDDRLASVSGSPQPKVAVRLGVRKEPCVVCGLPVFLAEKLVISRSLYHRTCFRCARCNNQLTLGNYYETEEGQYCCETCPDEEIAAAAPIMHQDYNKTALFGGRESGTGMGSSLEYTEPVSPNYKRALSDEEKSSNRSNELSVAGFEPLDSMSSEINSSIADAAKIRLNFMTSHLLSDNIHGDSVPVSPTNDRDEQPHPVIVDKKSKTPDESDNSMNDETSFLPVVKSSSLRIKLSDKNMFKDSCSSGSKSGDKIEAAVVKTKEEGSVVNTKDKSGDNLSSSFTNDNDNQHLTAVANHDVDSKSFIKIRKDDEDYTKDAIAASGEPKAVRKKTEKRLSLVQQRLKIFENSVKTERDEMAGEGGEDGTKRRVNEPNSTVNITSTINPTTDEEKTVEEKPEDSEDSVKSSGVVKDSNSLAEIEKESSTQDSSANIELEDKSIKPSDPPEEKLISADVVLPKMTESQDPRRDLASVETSLSNVDDAESNGAGEYPEDLNPFQSDESDVNEEKKPNLKTPVDNKPRKSLSTNPFGSSDEDEDPKAATAPQPAARKNATLGNKAKVNRELETPARRRLQAPQISLNPFWSDDEDPESDDDSGAKNENAKNTPVPKPRKIKSTPEPSPVPRKTSLDRGGLYASNTSIASTGSLITPGGTYRKKKPAPPPPPTEEMFSGSSTFDTLVVKSPDELQSVKAVSPRTPRARKMKPAPPPPMSTSTPQSLIDSFSAEVKEAEESPLGIWDDQKNSKDETNRNRQSLSTVSSTDESSQHYSAAFVDKSAQGKWKRKKGPAPPRPLPHKRKIKVMSVKDVKLELDEIELQQQGLEKQGVRLEQLIRDKSETGQENEEFTSLRVDVEELVLELFALVNEKNELFRRQAELMLLRRQQRLEEEHADVEYQIRCLMSQPEATKTDSDKQREETLIQRLVEIVERRNEIVECLEMDRRREVEEDKSINEQMGLFAAKSKADLISSNDSFHSSSVTKKEKAKDKLKEKKIKKSHKKDADKDVDETEMKLKRHKKKWF